MRAFIGIAARGRRPNRRGGMNKTEAAYATLLDARLAADEIVWWGFEAMRLRVGAAGERTKAALYTPDFAVVTAALDLEFHEVKGRWEEAARVRIRAAAAQFPFRFVAVYRHGRTFTTEVFE